MSTSAASFSATQSGSALIPQIDAAIGAHGSWKLRLRTAIRTGHADVAPHDACRDDRCAFGQWLYSPAIDARVRSGVPYQVVRRLHAEFHQAAGQVLRDALRGQAQQAERGLEGAFAERSDKLVRALTKWKGELRGSAPS